MAIEPAPDDADIGQWLDGLAGRAGQGLAHKEGEVLRQALTVDDAPQAAPPSWAQIVARSLATSDPQPPLVLPAAAPAANQAIWRPWWGWAAAVGMGTALLLVTQSRLNESPALRGTGTAQAVWVVNDLRGSSDLLAAELRAAGAEVTIREQGPDLVLVIKATGAAAQAANERLLRLESALDSAGELTLRVTSGPR